MGGCIGVGRGRNGAIDDSSSASISRPNSGSQRKNHPLSRDRIRWKSDVPLTEGQLRSKRDEFWDTAPAFEGRKEIWDALRAASQACEAMDYDLAQAIVDGASVLVPNGYLTECYDELGARYTVPIYCLSYPVNIVKDGDGDDDDDDDDDGEAGQRCDGGRDSPAECSEPVDGGSELVLKLRLSHTCNDVRVAVYSTDTVSMCKKKLQSQEGIESSRQRWFYGGKLLGDKLHIDEAKIPAGYVVQVIVNTEDHTRKPL